MIEMMGSGQVLGLGNILGGKPPSLPVGWILDVKTGKIFRRSSIEGTSPGLMGKREYIGPVLLLKYPPKSVKFQ